MNCPLEQKPGPYWTSVVVYVFLLDFASGVTERLLKGDMQMYAYVIYVSKGCDDKIKQLFSI